MDAFRDQRRVLRRGWATTKAAWARAASRMAEPVQRRGIGSPSTTESKRLDRTSNAGAVWRDPFGLAVLHFSFAGHRSGAEIVLYRIQSACQFILLTATSRSIYTADKRPETLSINIRDPNLTLRWLRLRLDNGWKGTCHFSFAAVDKERHCYSHTDCHSPA
jgi:hypothetical protein